MGPTDAILTYDAADGEPRGLRDLHRKLASADVDPLPLRAARNAYVHLAVDDELVMVDRLRAFNPEADEVVLVQFDEQHRPGGDEAAALVQALHPFVIGE